jgi:hypothetical protein
MATNDSHRSPERPTRMSHFFGVLGKLHLLFVAALVLFPHLLSAQWNATISSSGCRVQWPTMVFEIVRLLQAGLGRHLVLISCIRASRQAFAGPASWRVTRHPEVDCPASS